MITGPDDWTSPRWRADAVAWLDARLADAGRVRTGDVTQPRIRSWGTVLTAPTTAGPVWMKATAPSTAYEVPIYAALTRVAPAAIVVPIALDLERGWLLLPDGGALLDTSTDAVPPGLAPALAQYAELQLRAAPMAAELVVAGVPDMRPAVMPARFDEAVAAVERFVAGHGRPGDAATLRDVVALRDRFAGWCALLAASPVPASVDHNDLHAANVFVTGGHARFVDWGDAAVAHPFASMLVGLGMPARTLAPDAVARLRDAYLEPFTDLAPRADLLAEIDLACRVAKVARTLTWVRAVGVDNGDPRFARGPIDCLAALLTWSPIALSGRASGTTGA